jgi:predicted transcriptional regulator
MQSKKFIGLEEDDDAVNALKLMTVNNIGRILVKKDETISGIVSRTDIHSVMIRLDYINNHK